MRPPGFLRPVPKTRLSWSPPDSSTPWPLFRAFHGCSCSAPLALTLTKALQAKGERRYRLEKKQSEENVSEPQDHQSIGASRLLFTSDISSPGTPFFLPDGTHIFQKLTSFIRAQYPDYGFDEVITPTIYKEALWKQSGHWENYKDDIFTVTGNTPRKSPRETVESSDKRTQLKNIPSETPEFEEYGLKPMNCPGHCVLFQSKRRSYRDLPIRYAEFSPLHRNEISGALSGLTRVRRFHQDDGHIFCRPSQVMDEVNDALKFVRMVYRTLHFKESDLIFVLSTRPKEGYIGTLEEWNMAEDQLKKVLDNQAEENEHTIYWQLNEGDGAFYGPKIDVILRDNNGKKQQTATIQLDFQLPKRFELEYDAPAPELEAKGETTDDPQLLQIMGRVRPVMIHRAVLGSLERFIALLLEENRGKLPFWLSPRQMIILTVTDRDIIVKPAEEARKKLSNMPAEDNMVPRQLDRPRYNVDLDNSGDSIAQKIVRAKKNKYNLICIMGEKNLRDSIPTMDVEVNPGMQPNREETWDVIEQIKPGSQAPRQMDRGTGGGNGHVVRLKISDCQKLIGDLTRRFL